MMHARKYGGPFERVVEWDETTLIPPVFPTDSRLTTRRATEPVGMPEIWQPESGNDMAWRQRIGAVLVTVRRRVDMTTAPQPAVGLSTPYMLTRTNHKGQTFSEYPSRPDFLFYYHAFLGI